MNVRMSAREAGFRFVRSPNIAVVSFERKKAHANEPLGATLAGCATTALDLLLRWLGLQAESRRSYLRHLRHGTITRFEPPPRGLGRGGFAMALQQSAIA